MDKGMLEQHTKWEEQIRKEYLDELKYLRDGESDANQTLDKAILSLTAAAFGLSIALSRELAPGGAQERWLLFVSWLFFTVSLSVTLVSLHSSVRSWRKEQEFLNDSFVTGKPYPDNVPSALTHALNTTSLACCLLGIALFALYVWLNLPK